MNFQFPAYPYASCQRGLVYMCHVRHSTQGVLQPHTDGHLYRPKRGVAAAGVWSRKRSLAALGGGLVVSSHSRGHCWKNPISSWFRGPFDITVIRGSTISFQLLTLESYWIISVPYLCGQSTLVAERRAPWDFISGSGGPTFFFLTALENFSQRQWSNFHLATL